MKRSSLALMLVAMSLCSYFLSACVTIKPVGEKHSEANNLQSVYQPAYETTPEFFGHESSRILLSFGVGAAAAGYGYFFAPTSYKIGRETITTTPVINAIGYGLLADVATYYLMKLFTPPLGIRVIQGGEESRWLWEFDQNLRYAGTELNDKNRKVSSLYFLASEQERSYTLRRIEDVAYFETAFPRSNRLVPFVLEGLPYLRNSEVEEVGKRFSFFNHNEAVQQKIREVAFTRESSIQGCLTLLQKQYPMARDIAENRSAEIAIDKNTREMYEEFFKAFPNGSKRAEVLAKAHEFMKKDLATCILPEHFTGFLARWEPPKLGDAATIAEAKKRYQVAVEEQKKYYSNSRKIQVASGVHTGMYVKKDSRVQITAEGMIVAGGILVGKCDARGFVPDGFGLLAQYSMDRRFNHAALLCRVGNSDWFFVGLVHQFLAPEDGMIYLNINDADYCNNKGYFTVKIASKSLENIPDHFKIPYYPGDGDCQRQAAEAQVRNEQYRKEQEIAEKGAEIKKEQENDVKQLSDVSVKFVEEGRRGGVLGVAEIQVYVYKVEFPDGKFDYIYKEKDYNRWCIDRAIGATFFFCEESREKLIVEVYRKLKSECARSFV